MILPARTYARAVMQDREIAEVIAVNEAHDCLDDFDRENFRRDRARAWRDITARPAPKPAPKDTSAWYAAQIAATERRIVRAEEAIARPIPGEDPDDLAHNNWRRREAATRTYLNGLRTRANAERDLSAARARLAWLTERSPA